MAIQIDLKLEKQIINTYIPMDKLFDMLGIEYSLHSNMYCPFHENIHSPAAHLHTDSNRLWFIYYIKELILYVWLYLYYIKFNKW